MICERCRSVITQIPCPVCKSNDYFRKRGKRIGTCSRCTTDKPLHSNQQCKECLKEQGLKECHKCHKIKLELLEFSVSKGTCKQCRNGQRDKRRNQQYQNKYGITLSQYDMMIALQEDRCGICGDLVARQNFAVDHDHATNRVRGLLCSQCNLGLGNFRDRPDILRSAILYLEGSFNGSGI